MTIEEAEIDKMLRDYRAAVDAWIDAIRQEVELTSANHSIAEIDNWRRAGDSEEEARTKVRTLKEAYESALRRKFFHF
jgi:selenocysteine lyase/cysteine desulfurase